MAENEETTSRHSFKTYFSFGTYNILWTIPSAVMGLFMIKFYHTIVGLDPILYLIVIGINTVWAAFNDPLIGYLTDRNFKFTRKWGRRFPWIIIGFIPQSLSLIMIFSPPELDPANPLPVMLWLLISLILFDLFITLVDIHVSILRADKFRTEKERKKYAGFFSSFDMIAQVVGMAIPPLLLLFGEINPLSYSVMAAIMALIAIIFGILFVAKGAREDKIIIDRYYSRDYERLHILNGVKVVIKQKSFMALYASYVAFLAATTIMTAMVAYLTTFILVVSQDYMTIFMALFLGGALISIPIWLKILKIMNNNKKVYLIGSFVLCGLIIPLTFFQTDIDLMIIMFLVGFGTGCVWSIGMPILYSNAQDDFVVRTGKNQKGILVGTWAVIGLVTAFIDELLIALVFTFTGFKAGLETFEALELSGADVGLVRLGIRLLLGIIPMLVLLTGTLIFWKYYPLTQEKVLENKAKLLELGF